MNIINLRSWCQKNNITCATCSQSYKNYYSETEYKLYCNCGGILVNGKEVCLDWNSQSK